METLHTAILVTGVPKKEHCGTETNYVDLGSTNTVKVTFTGKGNQQTIVKEHEEGYTDQRKDKMDNIISDMDLKIESLLEEDTVVKCPKLEDTDYTDMYLNSRCESDSESEDSTADESKHDVPVAEETESHYITTHEIQLTELDHDMDHELGRAASSCWDYEDENLVYSFVDYASFKSSEQPTGEKGQRRSTSSRPPKLGATKTLISTESECASSDDGARNTEEHVHVSIKAQTVSESPRPPLHENDLLGCYRETKTEVPYDSQAHCFIPAPGRQHLASKLKGKDVTEYSSGASSSVSELDDADKEVCNLTAKSFRSLACPYFDTIDLRPSSESSVSEHSQSMNKWSAFTEFNYTKCVTQGVVVGERKNSTCSAEMRKCTEGGTTEGGTQQINTYLSSKSQLGQQEDSSIEGVHKKAVFASSLLQNVISKKWLEYGSGSPTNNKDTSNKVVLQTQTSESGSVQSVVSVEDVVDHSNGAYNKVEEEEKGEETHKQFNIENTDEPQKVSLLEDHQICKVHNECDVLLTTGPTEAPKENELNSKTTKMSHLFVPGSHFVLPKERKPSTLIKETTESDRTRTTTSHASDGSNAPEKKLHSIKENKNNPERPFNIANLLTPNFTKHDSDTKSEKTRPFTVRDVRDNRCKLQTPIHRVRDVRKLVKSSYRLMSFENMENKTSCEESNAKKEQDKNENKDKTAMVIKCHSVNTNAHANANSIRRNNSEGERPPMQPMFEQPEIQMKSVRWKENCDKRLECKMANQVALEKLRAAVKTMEQLYVFDRNEWRRKTEAPHPVTDSHVLPLITNEKQRVDDAVRQLGRAEPSKTSTPGVGTIFSKSIMRHQQQNAPKIQCSNVRNNTSRSLNRCPSKSTMETRVEGTFKGTSCAQDSGPKSLSDSENYLTIPIKPHPLETKPHNSVPQPRPSLQHSPVITDSWSSGSPMLTFCQPTQILCVTPPIDTLTSNTQRKLLMDPITGQCYLVDTPNALQPLTQRLYCPESAQYLDIPVALSPAAYLIGPPSFLEPQSPHVCSQGESTSIGANTTMGGAKPINSITSQHGPHVVAPPSFDGTTMSFVVEHR